MTNSKTPNRLTGITEPYWSRASEELKFFWTGATRTLAILVGFLTATKTGIIWADVLIATVSGLIPLMIIGSQRSLSRFQPRWRRLILRVTVIATLRSITLLGLAVFLSVIYGLVRGVAMTLPLPHPEATPDVLMKILLCGIIVFALIKAPLNVFRGLDIERLIYDQPKRGLIQILACRRTKSLDAVSFALFELSIFAASYAYVSGAIFAVQLIHMKP